MKMQDLNANDIEGAMRIIEGTARSMGIESPANGEKKMAKRTSAIRKPPTRWIRSRSTSRSRRWSS